MRTGSTRGLLPVVRDAVRTQLWPVPVAAVVVAVAAGVGLPSLDAAIDDPNDGEVAFLMFGGDASAARTVLDAVASSLITVTSLTFSLTVVTLQLASSQFSPRLLRTFVRDRIVHVTLALFLATFTYALTVLRSVRSDDGGQQELVPRFAVTFSFVLALASVVALVLFLSHLARQLRVETMLRTVAQEGSSTIRGLLDEREPGASVRELPAPPMDAVPLPAATSGFLTWIDEEAILAAAVECGAVVVVDHHPGSFLVAAVPVGVAWPADPARGFNPDTRKRLVERVTAAISTGIERTTAQDVGFALRQLTDVANKALSPGINDPTTAVHALGYSASLVCELARRDLRPRLLLDQDGRVRVILRRPAFDELLDLVVAQPRRYGAADPDVLARLFRLLRELAWCAGPDQRAIVDRQLGRLRDTAGAQGFDDQESRRLADLGNEVSDALAGRWTVQVQERSTGR
jgi:uncharacterized membrane protein